MGANHEVAVRLYRGAADQGYYKAEYALGGAYRRGVGVAADPEQAAYWYKRASEQGFAKAQYRLARLLLAQKPPDERAAIEWTLRAARQGHAIARHYLGNIHLKGFGTPKDRVRAYAWFCVAEEGGIGESAAAAKILGEELSVSAHALAEVLKTEFRTTVSER